MIEDAVNWSARHGMEPLQRLIGVEGHPSGIAQQQEKKNVGIWRQRRDPLLHLLEGEIAEVGEVNPAREWFGGLLKHALPKTFERRCAHYDHDIFCRGRDLQHVFKEARNFIYLPDVSCVLL
jgi:hypothetical protein